MFSHLSSRTGRTCSTPQISFPSTLPPWTLVMTFSSKAYLDKKTGPFGLGRFPYLQALVTEFQDTHKQGYKATLELEKWAWFNVLPVHYWSYIVKVASGLAMHWCSYKPLLWKLTTLPSGLTNYTLSAKDVATRDYSSLRVGSGKYKTTGMQGAATLDFKCGSFLQITSCRCWLILPILPMTPSTMRTSGNLIFWIFSWVINTNVCVCWMLLSNQNFELK